MKIEITITPESANILAAAIVSAMGGTAAAITETSTVGQTKETSTVGQTKETASKPAKAPKAEKPTAPAVTLEDLRAVATECVNAGKKDKLVEINKSFGATGLSKIEPDKYPDVLKALKALAAEAPEEDPCA
jgi:hypothetical protein